jgi:hypothetical protein
VADVPIAVATKSLIAEINAYLASLKIAAGLPTELREDTSSSLVTVLPLLDEVEQNYSDEDTSERDAPKGFRESFRRGIVFEFKFEDD